MKTKYGDKMWIEDKKMLRPPTDFYKFWRMKKQVTGGVGISYGNEEGTYSVVIHDFGDVALASIENIKDLKTAEQVAKRIMNECDDLHDFELCAIDVREEVDEDSRSQERAFRVAFVRGWRVRLGA